MFLHVHEGWILLSGVKALFEFKVRQNNGFRIYLNSLHILGRKLKIMQCPLAPCRCRDGIMRFSRLAAIIIQHCFILGITSLNVFPIVAECQFCSSQWAFCFSCHISTATRNMLASPAMGWVPHATRIHEVRLFPCPAWCCLHLCKACAQRN